MDFADMIKLMIFKWGDYPGLCRWIQCNKKSIYKGTGRQEVKEIYDNRSNIREKLEDAIGFED